MILSHHSSLGDRRGGGIAASRGGRCEGRGGGRCPRIGTPLDLLTLSSLDSLLAVLRSSVSIPVSLSVQTCFVRECWSLKCAGGGTLGHTLLLGGRAQRGQSAGVPQEETQLRVHLIILENMSSHLIKNTLYTNEVDVGYSCIILYMHITCARAHGKQVSITPQSMIPSQNDAPFMPKGLGS